MVGLGRGHANKTTSRGQSFRRAMPLPGAALATPVITTTGDSMLKQLMPAIALAAAAFCAAQPALAQSAGTYPNKPIHIIVTFTSGGAPDILGRLIGEKLSAAWGQPVIVDNKP